MQSTSSTMAVQPTVVQYHLNTDSTVSALVSVLVAKGYMEPDKLPGTHVKHLTLTCTRPDCKRVFRESTNMTTKYALPIAHSLEHRHKAGEQMQQAVHTLLTNAWTLAHPDEQASLLTYYQAMVDLFDYLQALARNEVTDIDTSMLTGYSDAFRLAGDYIERWLKRVDPSLALPTAAYLARVKRREVGVSAATAQLFFKDYAEKLLKACNIPLPNVILHTKLEDQLMAMEGEKGSWWPAEAELARSSTAYFRNPLNYYQRRAAIKECQPLAQLGAILLSIVPSEASVERTFSALKMQWTAKRNRLEVSTVNNLLRLQLNAKRQAEVSDLAVPDYVTSKYWLVNPAVVQGEDVEELAAPEAAESVAG